MYGLGEILEYLNLINKKLSKLEASTDKPNQSIFYENTSKRDRPIFTDRKINHSKDHWKCKECGRDNMNYVGTCGCGASRS